MIHNTKFIGTPAGAIAAGDVVTVSLKPGLGAIKFICIIGYDSAGNELTPTEMKADLSRYRVLLDDVPRTDISPSDLDDCDLSYYGLSMTDRGAFVHDAVPRHLESPISGSYTQIGTLGIDSIQIELTAAAVVTKLAKVKIYARRADYDCVPGVIRCLKTVTGIAVNTTNEELVHSCFGNKATRAVLAVHVCKNAGVLTRIGIKVNGSDKIGPVPYSVIKADASAAMRSFSADWYHLDFTPRNLLEDQIEMAGIDQIAPQTEDGIFTQAPISSLELVTVWTTKPGSGSDSTRAIVETLEAIPATVLG